jgi:hypothetical protein
MFWGDRRRITFLAEICQQQQKSSKTLFARIEKLVDQILFDPAVAFQ